MRKTPRENSFRVMLPTILALALPTMLEQLTQTAVQYIDTAMVGTLGTQATASVGATASVNWMIGNTISAIGVGFLAYISQSIGAGRGEDARKASGQAVTITLLAGIFFTALTCGLSGMVPVWMQVDPSIRKMASRYFLILYSPMLFRAASIIFGTLLRAAGDTRTPMKVGILVNVINVVMNYFLIYGPHTVQIGRLALHIPGAGWGIDGAAIASALAFVVGGTVMTIALWRHPRISPRRQRKRPDLNILRPCFRVAFPNMLQRFATTFGFVAFASMINSLGETSTAAHTIANTVESGFYIPGWGMQTAAATLAGNAYGAHDESKLKDLSRTIIPLEVCLMVTTGGLLFAFAPSLVRIFTKDPEVIRLGSTVLRMVALSEPFYGIPIVIEGMMQGVGKTVAPFIFNIIGMWCVRIAGTFVCTQLLGYGLVSAWACMIAHNLLLCILFSIHYLRGRWKPQM